MAVGGGRRSSAADRLTTTTGATAIPILRSLAIWTTLGTLTDIGTSHFVDSWKDPQSALIHQGTVKSEQMKRILVDLSDEVDRSAETM